MGLMCQVPHPFRFRYSFALPMSGLSPNDDPLNFGKVYHANIIKHRFKGHMIMSAMDMLPQSPDTVFSLLEVTVTPNQALSNGVEKTMPSGLLVKNRY